MNLLGQGVAITRIGSCCGALCYRLARCRTQSIFERARRATSAPFNVARGYIEAADGPHLLNEGEPQNVTPDQIAVTTLRRICSVTAVLVDCSIVFPSS